MKQDGPFDAVVVGSGAGGAMAAWVLAERGLKVLMLEAGRHYDPYRETPMFALNEARAAARVRHPREALRLLRCDRRRRLAGAGRTLYERAGQRLPVVAHADARRAHQPLGAQLVPHGPYDFKPKSRDGLGVDWPIAYEDLAPWYDKTEAIVGVYGSNSGLENHPDSGPGVLHDRRRRESANA